MDENNSINNVADNQIDEQIDLKNKADSLVQEELTYSHTQSSQHKRQKELFISGINEDSLNVQKSKEELLQDVILSLAMEQRAVAQFIQAEAKHIQAYIQYEQEHSKQPFLNQSFQADLVRIVEGLVEKQKMSMRLLDMTRFMLKEE